MSASENISHVIFDVDGLLLDTERLYARASAELLAEHGKEYDWGVKAKLMGKAPKEVAEEYVRHFQLPITPEEYLVKTRATMEKLLPDCKFLPGALKLLHHFYKNKIPMAIATGSIKSVHEQKTRPHDKFFSVFEHVVTSEDEEVKIGKPAPDIYSVCTSRFAGNISPGSCLAFEDAPNGVASARAAGMPVVMVPGPWIEAGDLTKNATLLLKDLRDFDPSSFGLPAFGYRREVTHVIFDMDDTLVDSVHRYSAALRKLMGKHGVLQKFTGSGSDRIASFRASIVGQPADVAIPKLVKHFQLEVTAEELLAEFDREALEVLPQSKPLPGVERLVKHLHERGIPMAVATSTTRARYEATSRNLKHLFSLFSHVVTMDDPEMGQPKPAPDIFLLASKRFSDPPADPKRCLVFEDAVSGAEGAAAGGMQCVLVPERNNMTPENSVWGTQLLQTMEEFRPEDFGLPEFSS